ncbi:MAG TPA: VWA domain-containing protein [Candidatus Acidoferrum sp.]|nr:VWA domain-containing protein [Candidatus Acidoferrum sp.]
MLRSFLCVCVGILLATEVSTAPQQVPPPPDDTQNSPTIRRTTRVVNVDVVVTDRKGQPVQGLGKEAFQILDNGQPEQIALFSAQRHTDAPTGGVHSPIPGEYSNDPQRSGIADEGASLILFDTINTGYLSQAYSLGKIRIFLQQLRPEDHVGVYVLTEKGLKVVHDLGQPASALINAMQRYNEPHGGGRRGKEETAASTENSTGLVELDRFLHGKEDRRPLTRCDPDRFPITFAGFQEIARRSAGLGGRKAVIWVTEHTPLPLDDEENAFDIVRGKFCGVGAYDPNLVLEELANLPPLSGSRRSRPVQYPPASSQPPAVGTAQDKGLSENDELDLVLRLLNQNNIALYPVSAEGLQTVRLFGPGDPNPNAPLPPAGMDATAPLPRDTTVIPQRVMDATDAVANAASHQHMEELARLTGGRAYFDRNDLETGIRRALDDAQNGYELAYYPDHDRWNGDWRKIEVKVNRPGVTVLARAGYYAFPEPKLLPPKASKQLLEEIATSPLEDTEIPVTVKLTPSRGVPSGTVEARVYVNAQTMFSNQLGHGWKSDFEVLFFQLTAKNKILDVTTETVGLELTDAKYTKALKEGFDTVGTIQLKPGAALLCVIVHDKKTDAVGSVRISLDQDAATVKRTEPSH